MGLLNNDLAKDSQFSASKKCICRSKQGVFFSDKYISFLVSGLACLSFLIFITGFFLGKKKAIEKFCKKIEQESFSDTIYSSVCSLYPRKVQNGSKHQETILLIDDGNINKNTKNNSSFVSNDVNNNVLVNSDCKKQTEKYYYAELIGFGTERAAKKFTQKLQKNHISVTIKNRKSKSSKGRVTKWYQVVTEKFNDKSDLCAFVDTISIKENLKGVRIVQC